MPEQKEREKAERQVDRQTHHQESEQEANGDEGGHGGALVVRGFRLLVARDLLVGDEHRPGVKTEDEEIEPVEERRDHEPGANRQAQVIEP